LLKILDLLVAEPTRLELAASGVTGKRIVLPHLILLDFLSLHVV